MWRILQRSLRPFANVHMSLLQTVTSELTAIKPPDHAEMLLAYPASRGFTLTESLDSTLVTLAKEQDGVKVTVTFMSRPALETNESDEEGEEENDDEPWIPENTFSEFQVALSRGGVSVVYECQSASAFFDIKNVVVTSEQGEALKATSVLNDHLYRGPAYSHLEPVTDM